MKKIMLSIGKDLTLDYAYLKTRNHLQTLPLEDQKKFFEDAIKELNDFDTDDIILEPVATAAIGDANMELGKTEEAITFYLKAAKVQENKFTTPIYLMKAGLAYEELNNYANAIKIYEQIKSEYPESNEGREIEKYLVKAHQVAGI